MIQVAKMESRFTHYKEDGTVLEGWITKGDLGLFQISRPHWQKEADRLGLNLHNIVDNVKMARYIYDKQGITAWVAWNQFAARI
jgi:hypothetical protein